MGSGSEHWLSAGQLGHPDCSPAVRPGSPDQHWEPKDEVMEPEKTQIEEREVTLGNPTTTRVITENPTAEGCNTTRLRDNLGTEQGAVSQP